MSNRLQLLKQKAVPPSILDEFGIVAAIAVIRITQNPQGLLNRTHKQSDFIRIEAGERNRHVRQYTSMPIATE